MFRVLEITKDDVIAIQVTGEITKEDYDNINPLVDKTVKEYGKVRLFIQMEQIDAFKPDAMMKDLKMYFDHFNHLRKVAIVGDSTWQKLVAGVTGPFISGKIKHFPSTQFAEALKWVQE